MGHSSRVIVRRVCLSETNGNGKRKTNPSVIKWLLRETGW
jgi:hypothetical protein